MIALIAVTVSILIIYVAYALIVGIKWENFVDKHVDIGNTRIVITACGIIFIAGVPWILAYLLGVIYV